MPSEGLHEQLDRETDGYVLMFVRKDGDFEVCSTNERNWLALDDAELRADAWLAHCVAHINAETEQELLDDEEDGDGWKRGAGSK